MPKPKPTNEAHKARKAREQRLFAQRMKAAGFVKMYVHKDDKPKINKMNAKRKIPSS